MIDLEVKVGKRGIKINSRLLDIQDAWDNLDEIKTCHEAKLTIYSAIDDIDNPVELREYAKQLTALEFKLQFLWGFPIDANFHRFWDTPKCTCPQMDNDDWYGTSMSYINGDCPIHGGS
jgi:hypothetical protein